MRKDSPNGSDPKKVLLEAEGLQRTFGSGATAVNALRDVGLAVREGEMVAIMGPSGSGKSTLLHILGALDPRRRLGFDQRAPLRQPLRP